MPLKNNGCLVLILFMVGLYACQSSRINERFYTNQYTTTISKHNGTKKLLSNYRKLVIQTFDSHNNRSLVKGAFWIPDHPVSFEEYKQFMDYCRDSIARMLVGYVYNSNGNVYTDWSKTLAWRDKTFFDKLDVITTPYNLRALRGNSIHYSRLDYKGDSSFLIGHTWILPDTSYCCRINSTTAMIFDESAKTFPVNGLNYEQAMAFCNWLSVTWNNTLEIKNRKERFIISLPEPTDSALLKSAFSNYNAANNRFHPCKNAAPYFFIKENGEKTPETTCNYLLWIKIKLIDN